MGSALVPGDARRERHEPELMRLMQTYGGLLAGLCTAMLQDSHLAQDIVQETFLRAWQKLDSLRGGRMSEKAWLCRIALNLCRDHQRTRWFRMVDRRKQPEDLPLEAAPADEETANLLEAVRALSPRMREVIVLHYQQDMNAEEVARTLGISESAVYRRLRQAREEIKRWLEGAS